LTTFDTPSGGTRSVKLAGVEPCPFKGRTAAGDDWAACGLILILGVGLEYSDNAKGGGRSDISWRK
jgi:hypothetical protein